MNTLSYHAQPPFQRLADKAARAWNRALGVEAFRPAQIAQMLIGFNPVDRSTQPDRVAQHERIGVMHRITLAPDIRWRITRWERFWGLGKEDALAALLHEFGHCLGLPHSHNFTHVMHSELGSTVISAEEAKGYRAFLNL
jgi:hypothetical protein